jgi:polar amino acid transport system substrate-binding protein
LKLTPRAGALGAALIATASMLAGCSGSATAVPSNCTPESQFKTLHDKTLTIAGPDYPPLFTYQAGAMDGVEGKILEGFAAANCLTTDVKSLPAAGVVEAVKGGQADLAAGGWYPTPERAKVVNLTDPMYGDPVVLVAKNPSPKLEDYAGKKIGTTQGYNWVDDLTKWAGDNAKLYQSPDAVYQDLQAGRIDVALMAVNEAAYRLSKSPGGGLGYVQADPSPLIAATERPAVTAFPITKGNDDLTAAVNKYVQKLRDSGKLAEILKQFNIDPAQANPPKS